MTDIEVTRTANMDMCIELAEKILPNCEDCNENYNVKLTGTYIQERKNGEPLPGVYLEVTCRKCGKTFEDGDSEFWDYYEVNNGMIESKEVC